MKIKPTRVRRVGGKNFADSYPRAGSRQQQHTTLAAGGKNIVFRIGAASAGVKPPAQPGVLEIDLFCISPRGVFIVYRSIILRTCEDSS